MFTEPAQESVPFSCPSLRKWRRLDIQEIAFSQNKENKDAAIDMWRMVFAAR